MAFRADFPSVYSLYKKLLRSYGPQGWWPIIKRGRIVYHPKNYECPRNEKERFQIIIGALLAQNTSWKNAEKALLSLHGAGLLSFSKLRNASEKEIARLIRSSGYYNQKAKRIKNFLEFYPALRRIASPEKMRESLLSLNGIGPETADSILLYAFKQPFFVVDAYTRRFCAAHGLCHCDDYEQCRSFFERNLPRDFRIYNEYHALIVQWGKEQNGIRSKRE